MDPCCSSKCSLMKSESYFTEDLFCCLKTETETNVVSSAPSDSFYGLHLLAEVAAAELCGDRESVLLGSCGTKPNDKNGSLIAVLAAETSGEIPRKRRSVRRKKKLQGVCGGANQFQWERGLKRRLETESSSSKSRSAEEDQDGLKLKKRRLVICHGGFRFNLGAVRTKRENTPGFLSYGSGGSNLLAY